MGCSRAAVPPLLIRYISHGYPTGYGEAARRLINALIGAGHRIHWVPIRFDDGDPFLPDTYVTQLHDLEPWRATTGVPDVVVVHAVPEMLPFVTRSQPAGVPVVAHTVWEAEQLQAHWPALLNACDGVVVPTKWNAEAFVTAGVSVPVTVVPHIVDTQDDESVDNQWLSSLGVGVGLGSAAAAAASASASAGSPFIVHSVAAWIPRKAPWLTVEAYARAFGPADDTLLILRTNRRLGPGMPSPAGPEDRRRLTSWSMASILHRHGPTGRVHIEHEMLSGPDLAALHRRSDCWLSLPHSEGWNLGAFDAATAGTPVVTTAHGGPSEYLDPDVTHLIPGLPVAAPDLDGVTWVDPDVDVAVEALRAVWRDPVGARQAAADQAASLRRTYAPPLVARQFMDALVQAGVG
jgi:glycosyltransferase involved in cell wall biosynthesis